jgi:ESS family glutamate:Na+ symporter
MVSFIALCLLLGAGHFLRSRIKLLQRLYLPSCVIGGLAGLVIIQTFAATDNLGGVFHQINVILSQWSAPWSELPAFLINIVFACLFLGVKLPNFSTLSRRAGPQVVYGQVVAWGQYVVALGLWVVFLGAMFPKLPDMFAGILPVGFEGGHGTAAGLGPVFAEHGWQAGQDFALTSATCGIISAIIVGMILINWAARKGYVQKRLDPAQISEDDSIGVIPLGNRPSAGQLTVRSSAIETFSLHIVIVAVALALGYLFKGMLVFVESLSPWLSDHKLISSFPLFPLCMLGGLVVQICEDRFDKHKIIDLGLMRRIQNSSLDFLIIAAIATIKLDVILAGLVPLLILVAAGIGWNVFCVLFLARRMLPDAWFERSIAEMGQSMGVTATGLLLLRVVDPDYETPAADAFACKQLIHEPFMGGGLWTGAAIPLIAVFGAGKVLIIAGAVLAFWLGLVFLPRIFGKKPHASH